MPKRKRCAFASLRRSKRLSQNSHSEERSQKINKTATISSQPNNASTSNISDQSQDSIETTNRPPTKTAVGLNKIMAFHIQQNQKTLNDRRIPTRTSNALRKATTQTPVNNKDVQLCWEKCVKTHLRKDTKFFSYSSLLVSASTSKTAKQSPFKGVFLTHMNNLDIQFIHKLKFETHLKKGLALESYQNLLTVCRQLGRFSIICDISDIKTYYLSGELFATLCNLDFIKEFMTYFTNRHRSTTIVCKAQRIATLCDFAHQFFQQTREEQKCSLICAVLIYIRSVIKTYRRISTDAKEVEKRVQKRLEAGSLLLQDDFLNCINLAKVELKDILHTFCTMEQTNGIKFAENHFRNKWVLIQKWCINILVLLVLTGGGQRNQAYCSLTCPSVPELQCSLKEGKNHFGMVASNEKRNRSLCLPRIYFPASIAELVIFHIESIIPIILEKWSLPSVLPEDQPFLVDTRSGRALRSDDIRKTLQSFMKRYDHELTVNVLSIRASVATNRLTSYFRGETCNNMNEDGFLSYLSKAMCTSVEQLRKTYASIDEEDFEGITSQMIDLLDTEKKDETESPPKRKRLIKSK